MRKLIETKLLIRNLIKGKNTWVVSLIRYSGPILTWTREELKANETEIEKKKLLTMYKALHLKDDVERLYVPREKR